MVLPLFAAFVKGAAEAGEDMIDFKAKTDAEKAALAEKYKLDFESKKRLANYEATLKKGGNTKSAGPYTFQSDLQEGSKGYNLQYLTTLNAGIQSDPNTFNDFVKRMQREGTLSYFYTRVRSIFKAHQSDETQTIKMSEGAEGITMPTEKKFANIFDALRRINPTAPPILPAQALRPSVASINNTPVNQEPTPDQPPQEESNKSGAFIIKKYENSTDQSVKVGAQRLAALWNKKTKSKLSQGARNADTFEELLDVLTKPLTRSDVTPLNYYAADILDETKPSTSEARKAFGNALASYVESQPLANQAAAASQVSNLFRAFSLTTLRQDVIEEQAVDQAGTMSPITRLLPGEATQYYRDQKSRNPAGKKEFVDRKRSAEANRKVVNLLGNMQQILEDFRGQGIGVGGNFLQQLRLKVGGLGQILGDFIDTSKFTSEYAGMYGEAQARLMGLAGRDLEQLNATEAGAVFNSLNQIVAFALAQIVQTGADKISNADVENMKAALASSFSSTGMQIATIDAIRRMALKNLMSLEGYVTARPSSTGLPVDFGDYIAANQQYKFIREAFPSFNSTISFRRAVDKIENRTSNFAGGYNIWRKYGETDDDFNFVASENATDQIPPLWASLEGALRESASTYQPQSGVNPPDYVNVYRQLVNAKNSNRQKYSQLKTQYLNFVLTGNTRETNDLSSKIYDRLPENVKQNYNFVSVKVVHVKNLGYVPFAKIRKSRTRFELRRMAINNISLFTDEEDAIKAFEGQTNVQFRATGGPIPISDRLKNLQKEEK